jgi:glucuronate isomerase
MGANSEAAADIHIVDYASFSMPFGQDMHFHEAGCRLSDHGIEHPYAEDYSLKDIVKFSTECEGKGATT